MMKQIKLYLHESEARSLRFLQVIKENDERLLPYITFLNNENIPVETKESYALFGYDFARMVFPWLQVNDEEIYLHLNAISSRLNSLGFNLPKDLASKLNPVREIHSYSKKLAVLVAHRGRQENLAQTLNRLQNYFKTQQPEVTHDIFVVEQFDDNLFNKGQIFNAVINHIKDDYDYVLINDVDIFPVVADFRYPNVSLFRLTEKNWGASLLFMDDIIKVNGFSNNYWGWGYEDNDLEHRFWFLNIPFEPRDFIYDEINHSLAYTENVKNRNQQKMMSFVNMNSEEKVKQIQADGLSNFPSRIKKFEVIKDNIFLFKIVTNKVS